MGCCWTGFRTESCVSSRLRCGTAISARVVQANRSNDITNTVCGFLDFRGRFRHTFDFTLGVLISTRNSRTSIAQDPTSSLASPAGSDLFHQLQIFVAKVPDQQSQVGG